MNHNRMIEMTRNALIGQAVGDAFGVPVEFLSREEVRALDLREMAGVDTEPRIHSRWGDRIPAGSWSDDTSMTIASMGSFIRNGGRIDYADQLLQFVRWWEGGEYCCLSYPFGLGGNVAASLERFRRGVPPLECGGRGFRDNGNGALMRILPFSLYCIFHQLGEEETVTVTGKGSAITHGHEISRMSCFAWTEFLRALSEGVSVEGAIAHIESIPYSKWFSADTLERLNRITGKTVRSLTEEDIGETGYVVDTLYTALYSLQHAGDYETGIRNAVNLGYDTDTAATVTGMAAGLLYGREGIPRRWLDALRKREELERIAVNYAEVTFRHA